jgi:hypothetical protein
MVVGGKLATGKKESRMSGQKSASYEARIDVENEANLTFTSVSWVVLLLQGDGGR